MNVKEQKIAAKAFYEYWKDKGYEKGESQPFWLSLLRDVFGVEHPEQYINFEEQVMLDHTSFIDGFIPKTRVLIEQKSKGKDLKKPIRQSDGSLLTPFQQAKKYVTELPLSKHPRWIITSNFEEFLVYDMEKPHGEPEAIALSDLEKEYYRLQILVNKEDENIKKEMEISIKAGNLVGVLYDEILKQYINPESEETLKSLNQLCVRLVFCLYAEDAGIFGGHGKFHNYINSYSAEDMRDALIKLFEILDTKPEERSPYLKADLAEFPYVNGGLFAEENIEIPQFNDTIRNLLLKNASEDFDWSDISPTIFGAVFESTLNPETRRSGGMHYTSIENIHKVIDPLFLDELKDEFAEIEAISVLKTRNAKLMQFRKKLGTLTFLDPAAGSGNFLTETYISLRRLENKALKMYIEKGTVEGQIMLGDENLNNPIEVSINQFYGIEINDFAVSVAKTALWIAESQMMKETEDVIHMSLDFLPLKSYANIIEANALRIDWETVVPKDKLNYIMGNPPFVGYKLQNIEQKNDLISLYGQTKNIDYVSGWYFKAAEMMQNGMTHRSFPTTSADKSVGNDLRVVPQGNHIKTAFVSTNSICQGEQVASVWKPLYDRFNIEIDFAHQTFRWDSEASLKAHVHCVIVGFSPKQAFPPRGRFKNKVIYTDDRPIKAENINAYLVDADNIFIEKRNSPICECERMLYGSEPREGGFLIFSEDEMKILLHETPEMEPYIKRFVSSEDFINNKIRYCLWFDSKDLRLLKKSHIITERLRQCKEFREKSKQAQAHKTADTPYLFASPRQPQTDYLLIPVVSSENRKYIPIGYMSKDIILSNACFSIANASLYTLGILLSNVHMSWMRAVCGRLKSDYSYSNTIVYNNFPWPSPTPEQKAKIEQTAQDILDARSLYSGWTLADLYDELTMPPELRKAHQENDRAVMRAYGFDIKTMTESSCVAELMKMYQKLTEK